MKRCGGIGDVLAGTIATFVAWQVLLTQRQQQDQQSLSSSTLTDTNTNNDGNEHELETGTTNSEHVLLACYAACSLVKRATKNAYDTKHRAMLAQDVIHAIGPTFQQMMNPPPPNKETATG